ncbi:MAG: hypothetical protein AABZ53_16215, partial [Planctomycetota bacterium]
GAVGGDSYDQRLQIAERVSAVLLPHLEGSSMHKLGTTLRINRETLRRMYADQKPSVELLVRICEKFAISGEWLLTGKGPQKREELRKYALQEASPGELYQAVAQRLSCVEEQLARLAILEAEKASRTSRVPPRHDPSAGSGLGRPA